MNEVLTINIEDTNEELAINIEEASEELAINTEEVSEEHVINSDEISKDLFTNSQEVSEELAINYEQVAKKSIHENDELAINSNEVSEELAINSTHESEEFAIKSANDDEVFDVDSHSFPLASDNEYEDDLVTSALQEHREQQACERQKLYKHRKKCYDSPHKYMGLIIDGMDQKKTVLPHFAHIPKNMKEENFIQMHLVGCLVFNGHIIPKEEGKTLIWGKQYSDSPIWAPSSDSDGALVDSAEEDGSSTSVSKNSYEETPDSDGVSLDDDIDKELGNLPGVRGVAFQGMFERLLKRLNIAAKPSMEWSKLFPKHGIEQEDRLDKNLAMVDSTRERDSESLCGIDMSMSQYGILDRPLMRPSMRQSMRLWRWVIPPDSVSLRGL
eukprot:Gb_03948 [translate_table: standard]